MFVLLCLFIFYGVFKYISVWALWVFENSAFLSLELEKSIEMTWKVLSNWFEMLWNDLKRHIQNDSQCYEMTRNVIKWLEMFWIDLKWNEMFATNLQWFEMLWNEFKCLWNTFVNVSFITCVW